MSQKVLALLVKAKQVKLCQVPPPKTEWGCLGRDLREVLLFNSVPVRILKGNKPFSLFLLIYNLYNLLTYINSFFLMARWL